MLHDRETMIDERLAKSRPNRRLGGQVSHIEVGTFLRSGANGPEQQALLRLIGRLAETGAEPAEEPDT